MSSKLNQLINDYYSLECEFNIDKSIEVCKEILKIDPSLIEYQESLASSYYNKEEYQKSLDIYNECIEKTDDKDMTYFMIALCYLKLNDRQNAFLSIENIKDKETYLLSKSRLYKMLEEYDKAIEYGDKLLEENPENTNALTLMSNLYSSINDNERSLFYFKELSNITPELKSFELIHLFSLHRYDEVIEIFEDLKSSGIFDNDLEEEHFCCIIGLCYYELDKPYESLKYLINSDRIKPDLNKKITIAKNYLELCEFKCAHRFLKEALEIDEENETCLFLITETSYYLEDYLKAIEYSNKLLNLYGYDKVFHILAAVYFDLGDNERGYESLEVTFQVLRASTEPYEGEYIMDIASRLSKSGRYDRAEHIYNLLESKYSYYYYIYLFRGKNYKRMGRMDLAKKDYEKYRDMVKAERKEFEEVLSSYRYI